MVMIFTVSERNYCNLLKFKVFPLENLQNIRCRCRCIYKITVNATLWMLGEIIGHLLVSCVFTWQTWYSILHLFGLQAVAPQMDDLVFVNWWDKAGSRFSGQVNKGFNSIILGEWLIWKHRNYCVFDGGTPNLTRVISAREEAQQWSVEGAKGVAYLLALVSTS